MAEDKDSRCHHVSSSVSSNKSSLPVSSRPRCICSQLSEVAVRWSSNVLRLPSSGLRRDVQHRICSPATKTHQCPMCVGVVSKIPVQVADPNVPLPISNVFFCKTSRLR